MTACTINRRSVIAGGGAGALIATGMSNETVAKPVRMRTVRVATRSGMVEGRIQDGVIAFDGIPYGADTGPSRFQPPQEPEPWRGIGNGPDRQRACWQNAATDVPQSEDCLFLNLTTPRCDSAQRPVLVYVHGGAYMTGTAADPLYDGAALAAKHDVVVVRINHRLNVFGYLYLDPIARKVGGPSKRYFGSGNAGQADLILALHWIRTHIRDFGGDPSRILIFGQSGGGAKIATLMAQPDAAGLFNRVLTMSGQQVTASGPLNATRRTRALLSTLGVPETEAGLSQLQKIPQRDLLQALKITDPILQTGGLYLGPVMDGKALMRHPFFPDAPRQSARIPMIIGNTREETRYFYARSPEFFTLDWAGLMEALPGGMRVDIDPTRVIDTYRRLYPEADASTIFFLATTVSRSWRGAVEELEARARQVGRDVASTWTYQLNWKSPLDAGRFGACHTLDIPLMFGTTRAKGALSGDGPEARRLADQCGTLLARFARTGDPRGPEVADWAPYDLGRRTTLMLDLPLSIAEDPRGEERRLFASVPYVQPGT
ncbi:MAG: carboxylesterase/lipase family protein [Asticcacaulis sp.]